MAKKNKGGSHKKATEKEFDLPEGLELLETNGWGSKAMKWIKNNFSAIILPIIALIILGGGIYLYSQQKGEGLEIAQEDLESGITIDLGEEILTEEEEVLSEETEDTIIEEEEIVVIPEIIKEDEEEIEEDFNSGDIKNIYTETAEIGDGITHLARRALKDYLSRENIKLSAEQKIYIEDYMQNETGTRSLGLGETVSFSRALVENAISQAQLLTDSQLQNLEQYSRLVPSLN